MKVTLLYTLNDGTTHSTTSAALKHQDKVAGDLVLRIGEVFANKTATEIAKLIATSEEVLPLMAELVEGEEYLKVLEGSIEGYRVCTQHGD